MFVKQFDEAVQNNNILEINFDDTYGCLSSLIEESFGELEKSKLFLKISKLC